MTADRKFSSLESIKRAVSEVAKEADIPSTTFPSTLPAKPDGEGATVTPLREAKPRKKVPAPVRRVALDLPEYLLKDVAKRALEQGCTKRYIYLEAFRALGLTVHDVDFQEDGRRES